nr:putative toxin-antitoxin system toxin component, PIN family [uncultured Albidiferax sp.]
MRRIVIDTNIVLSGLLWRGLPHLLLTQLGQNPGMQLFSSPALLDELADVLTRPSLTKRLHQIHMTTHAVLADYVRVVTVVQPQPLSQPVCRDPDDDEVLALALSAQADVIVSGDNDLLVLQSFEGIAIITAAEALQRLGVGSQD